VFKSVGMAWEDTVVASLGAPRRVQMRILPLDKD
jgi:hypothetical protein